MLLKGKKKSLDNICCTLCYQLVKLHDPNNHLGLLKIQAIREHLPYSVELFSVMGLHWVLYLHMILETEKAAIKMGRLLRQESSLMQTYLHSLQHSTTVLLP